MLFGHAKRLWGTKWPLAGGLPVAYLALVAVLGDFRPEHAALGLLILFAAYWNERSKRFYLAALPYLITAIGYDAVRYPRAWLLRAEGVLGCDLRRVELAWFSVSPNVTLQDWFQIHHHPVLDILCAVPYFAFVYVVLGYSVYLYWVDYRRMQRFLWAYAIGSFIGFGFWLFLPAAPPWYLQDHGCLIDLAAMPSPAGLSRVDELLGIGYFGSFYSRASSVFGAVPSMHCAFPFMGLLVSWRVASWKTRPIHLVYTLLMAFSAVYLRHHWVIDVMAGWGVALVSVLLANGLVDRLSATHRAPAGSRGSMVLPPEGGVS